MPSYPKSSSFFNLGVRYQHCCEHSNDSIPIVIILPQFQMFRTADCCQVAIFHHALSEYLSKSHDFITLGLLKTTLSLGKNILKNNKSFIGRQPVGGGGVGGGLPLESLNLKVCEFSRTSQ